MDHYKNSYGTFGNPLEPHGNIQNLLQSDGTSWILQDTSLIRSPTLKDLGSHQNSTIEPCTTSKNHWEPKWTAHGALWIFMGPCGTQWNPMHIENVGTPSGPFGTR